MYIMVILKVRVNKMIAMSLVYTIAGTTILVYSILLLLFVFRLLYYIPEKNREYDGYFTSINDHDTTIIFYYCTVVAAILFVGKFIGEYLFTIGVLK